MDRAGFLYHEFLRRLPYEPTSCQDALMRDIGEFLTSDEGDILVVNGYAGTGKTTVIPCIRHTFPGASIVVVHSIRITPPCLKSPRCFFNYI